MVIQRVEREAAIQDTVGIDIIERIVRVSGRGFALPAAANRAPKTPVFRDRTIIEEGQACRRFRAVKEWVAFNIGRVTEAVRRWEAAIFRMQKSQTANSRPVLTEEPGHFAVKAICFAAWRVLKLRQSAVDRIREEG